MTDGGMELVVGIVERGNSPRGEGDDVFGAISLPHRLIMP